MYSPSGASTVFGALCLTHISRDPVGNTDCRHMSREEAVRLTQPVWSLSAAEFCISATADFLGTKLYDIHAEIRRTGDRIEDLETEMKEKFEKFGKNTNARFDKLDRPLSK